MQLDLKAAASEPAVWRRFSDFPRTASDKRLLLLSPHIPSSAEAAPLIERLGLVHDPDKFSAAAPSKCFSGSYQGAAISVVTNGKCARFGVDQIGTVAAGLSTWLSVEVRGESSLGVGRKRCVRAHVVSLNMHRRRVFGHSRGVLSPCVVAPPLCEIFALAGCFCFSNKAGRSTQGTSACSRRVERLGACDFLPSFVFVEVELERVCVCGGGGCPQNVHLA